MAACMWRRDEWSLDTKAKTHYYYHHLRSISRASSFYSRVWLGRWSVLYILCVYAMQRCFATSVPPFFFPASPEQQYVFFFGATQQPSVDPFSNANQFTVIHQILHTSRPPKQRYVPTTAFRLLQQWQKPHITTNTQQHKKWRQSSQTIFFSVSQQTFRSLSFDNPSFFFSAWNNIFWRKVYSTMPR